jgi:hypothetical protein
MAYDSVIESQAGPSTADFTNFEAGKGLTRDVQTFAVGLEGEKHMVTFGSVQRPDETRVECDRGDAVHQLGGTEVLAPLVVRFYRMKTPGLGTWPREARQPVSGRSNRTGARESSVP